MTPRAPTNRPHKEAKGYEEEEDLVVLHGTAEPHEGHQEQEGAHADDPRHHPDAGDQVEPFPPRCHANQQQTHQLRRKKTMLGWEKKEVQSMPPFQWSLYTWAKLLCAMEGERVRQLVEGALVRVQICTVSS